MIDVWYYAAPKLNVDMTNYKENWNVRWVLSLISPNLYLQKTPFLNSDSEMWWYSAFGFTVNYKLVPVLRAASGPHLWLCSAGIFRWNCDNAPSPAPGTMSSEDLRKLHMKVGTILQLLHASAPPTYLTPRVFSNVFLCNTTQSAITLFLSGFYSGGYYHGKLIFPREFPFKPPSIYMITPNGRFKCNTR